MKDFRYLTQSGTIGFVVADALGVPVEFMSRKELAHDPVTGMRSGGTHGQLAGTWSDDTSMMLCVMDSLTENGFDPDDQMARFMRWLSHAENTAHDEVFDVGGTTRRTIFEFSKGTPALKCGEDSEYSCGNGSLMRILPLVLYIAKKNGLAGFDDRAARMIHEASMCTHAHPVCLMACGIYCSVVMRLCAGADKNEAVTEGVREALAYYSTKAEFENVYNRFAALGNIGSWIAEEISGSGYVLHTLQASLWCLLTTDSYNECVLRAVNLGEDTDTTAAVAGSLAGLYYGLEAIPEEWLKVTAKHEDILQRCIRFADRCCPNW